MAAIIRLFKIKHKKWKVKRQVNMKLIRNRIATQTNNKDFHC